MIYTNSSFKYIDNIIPYPNIKKHLDLFTSIITSDNKPYGLHRSRNERFFMEKRLLHCGNVQIDLLSHIATEIAILHKPSILLKLIDGI